MHAVSIVASCGKCLLGSVLPMQALGRACSHIVSGSYHKVRALWGPVFTLLPPLLKVTIAALGAFLSYLWLKITRSSRHCLVLSPFGSSPGTVAAAP